MTNTRKHSSNSNNKTHRNRYHRRNTLMKGGNEANVVTPDTNVVTPKTKDENSETKDENSDTNVVTPDETKDENSGILSTISGALSEARDSIQRFASGDNTQPPSDVNPNTTDDLEKNVDEIDETHEQLVDALEEAKDKYLELTNALKQKQRAEDTISKLLEENPSFLTTIDSDAKSETINSQDTTLTEERDQDDASQDEENTNLSQDTTLTEEGDQEDASQDDMDEENTNLSQDTTLTEEGDQEDASQGQENTNLSQDTTLTEERSQEAMSEESQGDTTNSFDKSAPEEFDQSPRQDN